MKKQTEKSVIFNDRKINIVQVKNEWWIAVKPICEALGVDYIRQFKNMQEDEILSQLLSKQTTTGADGKRYEMVCLPEKYVYGWLFSIRSDSEALKQYKLRCYDILYHHFHHAIVSRVTALQTKTAAEIRMAELRKQIDDEMKQSAAYLELKSMQQTVKDTDKKLKELDASLIGAQIEIPYED